MVRSLTRLCEQCATAASPLFKCLQPIQYQQSRRRTMIGKMGSNAEFALAHEPSMLPPVSIRYPDGR